MAATRILLPVLRRRRISPPWLVITGITRNDIRRTDVARNDIRHRINLSFYTPCRRHNNDFRVRIVMVIISSIRPTLCYRKDVPKL